ncbi:putative oxidoreductase ucpA [Massariosphaeria phaeospora]|uniref:Putative oxidoreductase ucpA n=1 Tax=Massariosphaeria phaeospora TaxID=100035 RepID=A0A7C8MEP7_9PLEO|nr:putative oxidoreductase ucpA [Massariosphaeria phaeospora]
MAPPVEPHPGFAFTGWDSLHHDIYPAISASQTKSLAQPGKVVLVTGAGRGLGRATALQYAHANVKTLILCARTASQLDEVESAIASINSSIRVLKYTLDVTNTDAVKKTAEDVTAKEGRLDVLVNNAGYSSEWVSLTECDPEEWWLTLDINLKGCFLLQHAFLPLLASTAAQNSSSVHVINVSSVGAHTAQPGASAYNISKFALLRLNDFVNVEYGAKGVNAIAIHPGGVVTELSKNVAEIQQYLTDTPELFGGFSVWLTSKPRPWLSGRYVSAVWDAEKLESMKDEIVEGDKLKMKMTV